jgi:hypothetical protein
VHRCVLAILLKNRDWPLSFFAMSDVPHPSPRLHAELQRLFSATPDGVVRCLVIGIAAPADWPALSAVWRGVHTDWDWPAPAIAINGVDAFELWLPLQTPVPLADARHVVQMVCERYLGEVAPSRWRLWPALDDGLAVPPQALPQQQAATGRWSAFVAPDLAAVFGDEPALDMPPGDEAQADVLARIRCITPDEWRRALPSPIQPLPPALRPAHALTANPHHAVALPHAASAAARPSGPDAHDDPRRFLLNVMNDPTVDLVLRVEAAKALVR